MPPWADDWEVRCGRRGQCRDGALLPWRLAFIRRAKHLGFTLAEIGALLRPAGARSTADVVRAAEAKLAALDRQAAELARRQDQLRRLVRVCEQGRGGNCLGLDPDEPALALALGLDGAGAGDGGSAGVLAS